MPGTSLNFFTRLGFGKLKRKLSRKGSKKNRRESNSSEKTGMELKESIYNEPTTPARSHNQTIYVPKITLFPEVMPSCMPQATYGPNNEPLIRQPLSRTHPQQGNRGIMNNLKQKIMRGAEDDHDGLSVTYITERIIAMSFPADGQEATYKFHLKEVNKMLKTKHGDNYLIVNLSERRDDLHKMNPQVLDFGWPTQLAPPLERVCSICKSMDSWLNSDINHVVVIHCKGTQGRTGVILASFMHYCNICASADQALDRFAMKRFYDDKLASLTQPSQRRYVHYFAGLLSGAIKINSNALYLHHILIHGVPNFDTKGGCRPFIKIYQAMQPVFTSGVYNVTDNMQKICISIQPGIPLRGDILIKCYHKKIRSGQREVMWRAQFHTCAISDYSLIFSKSELDDGSIDPRFPENGKVELVFSPREGSLSHDKLTGFKSDVTVPVDEVGDALIRWDSYENFNALLDNNTLEDLKENGLPPGGIRFQNFNVTEFKNELPVEEGLYARVQKRRVETPLQNGSAPLENGSSHTHAPNVESGYSGYRGSELSSSSYSTASRSYNQLSSDTRKSNDQSQLDDILKDLMKDQATLPMVTRNKDGSQTKTWTTTSFGSSGDIPQKITVQRSETTFNQPGFREERVIKTSRTVHEEQKSDRPAYIPKNAFSYTPASAIESSRSFQSLERERVRSPSSGAPTPPIRTHTLPYRSDFDTRSEDMYMYRTVDSRSDSGQPLSWLQQQQTKLKTKQEVSSKPTSPDHLETTRTLDELERLLHSSAASISQPSTLQRSSGNSGYSTSEEVNTLKRSFESHQTVSNYRERSMSPDWDNVYLHVPTSHSGQKVIQQPQVQAAIPPREKRFVTEETESIALMPIGPGLQVLEPDNAGIVTVTTTSPRATTPGFPTSPATPPFPVSPRTPYINQAPYSPSSQFSPAFVSAPAHSHDFRRPLQSQVSHQSRFSDHDPLYASIPEDMSGETTGTPTLPRQGVVSQTVQYQQHHNYTQNQPVQVSTLQRDHHHQQQQQQQNFQSQYHTQQQQQQQQQYNYQTQQFHSGGQQHITQNGPATMPSHGSLHVDTSREYSGTLPRSPQSAGSPPSPGSLNIIRSQLTEAHNYSGSALSPGPHSLTGQSSPSVYFGLSRRGSLSSLADSVDTVNTTPRFVKDTSKYWYKANISREEAIQMLKNSPPGSFVVRDSNSFPGAFGLAIKVAQLPPNVQAKSSDPSADLVRHFLIEPHPKE
ncbi:tensin-3-like isoform X10 [Liolophura sinensis]|uniref:tensin-3-like isoform X10 n=1 Tax=Liolophura sinensis TaxID=3198878 RepID=UPI00315840BD